MKIHQFGFKFKTPPEGAVVLDCRVLPNPYRKGVDDAVLQAMVRNLEGFDELVAKGVELLKSHDEIMVGCLYGKHRSGAIAKEISKQTGAIIIK